MSGGGLILRLIDLVFILLFGFIVISQINTSKMINPPKSTEAGTHKDSTAVIIVGVLPNGQYPINDGQTVLPDSTRLQRYLDQEARKAMAAGLPLGVRIRANWDAPVRYSLAAAQICKDLGLPKGLDVVRTLQK